MMRNLTDALMTPAEPAPAPSGNSFSQGMRQGMTAAGGQLHALAGGVGEALGAQDFAARQYAQAKEAEELAATQAPAVTDWRQVTNAPDLSTGLRNAGSYVAGLAGQAVPMIGAGLGAAGLTAATGGGAVPALLAGTAAVAPFETGAALQRQQADPAALTNNSAGDRLATAALEGTGRALAMNAVPQLMGGKLLGAGAGAASKAGIVAEGVGGNALAGAAAEKISDVAQDHLNPNRDTSGDNARMLDAAIAGGALGVPFAGAGLAGHALHGKTEAPASRPLNDTAAAAAEPAAAPQSLVDRIRSTFVKGDDAAEKIAAGKDVIDVDALRAAPPEKQGEMLRAADDARVETAKSWFDELTKDGALSDENKAKLAQAGADLTDRANQAVVAGIKLAQEGGDKAMKMASAFLDAVSPKTESDAAPRDVQKSDVASGSDAAIADVVAPRLAKKFPQLVENDTAMKAVSAGLRGVMRDLREKGTVDAGIVKHLTNWFGSETPTVLAQLHDAVLDRGNPDATARYFRGLSEIADAQDTRKGLMTKVRDALPDDVKKSASDDQISTLVDHLREYARGDYARDMPPERARFEQRQISDALREHFGDKTDDLMSLFEKEHEKAKAGVVDDRAAPRDSMTDEDGFATGEDAGSTTEQDTHRQYFGAGRDKESPRFMLSEQAHRDQYGNEDSQAARVMRQVSSENPDMNVSTVTARDYARERGLTHEQLTAMGVKGDPADYVMVKAEGMKREGLNWQDVDRARLDTTKYSDSLSRIDTEEGTILDARKVLNMYAQEHKLPRTEQDAANPFYRLRRQFTEAIGALSDHLGESIDVHDSTVVARRGGRDITWGQLQKLGRVKDIAATDKLFADREEAMKAGDHGTVRAIDAKLDEHIMQANDLHDQLPDNQPKPVAVNNQYADRVLRDQLAVTATKLGEARTRAEAEISKTGPLRDGYGNMRALSPKERALVREHDKLVNQYNGIAERIGRDRMDPFAAEKDRQGISEVDAATGQIHMAEREHGDVLSGRVAASRNMEAGPEGNLLHADNFEPDTHFDGRLPAQIKGAISSRAAELSAGKSAVQRSLGAKAQHLLAVSDQMKRLDAADLATIVKDKDTTSVGRTINDLYRKYGSLTPERPKSTFVNRVLGKGDVNDVIRAMKVSDDTRGLQRAVDALLPHRNDASARAVLEVANERLGKLIEKDPGIAYSLQRAHPGNSTTSNARLPVKDYIDKVLGKTVDVEFAKMLHAGEFFTDPTRPARGLNADVIRVSAHALDPMSVGYHEALHGFFAKLHDAGLLADAHPLDKAASSPHVMNQLRDLLKNEPDALKQLSSPDERAAYMFQFWAAGKLTLPARPAGILGHVADFFRKVMGIWTNSERAEHIMQYFHSGEYGRSMSDRSAVARALAEGSNANIEKFKDMVAPLGKLAAAVATTGDARMRDTGIAALGQLADKVYAPLHGVHGDDPGYLPAARAKRGEFMNRLGTELGQHDAGTVSDALESLQR